MDNEITLHLKGEVVSAIVKGSEIFLCKHDEAIMNAKALFISLREWKVLAANTNANLMVWSVLNLMDITGLQCLRGIIH